MAQEPGSVSIEAAVSPAAKKMLDTTGSQLGYPPPAKDGDAWTVLDDAWRTPFRAAPDGTVRAKDARLRLRVYNPNAYPVTVASALAKVAMLK
ncbi:MAG: hypothetical protein ACJ72W_12620 [Actinoallomurus sp.]